MKLKKLKVFLISWKIKGGGSYVPPDPCAGGDYYDDKYGQDFITCHSMAEAKEVVKIARPTCTFISKGCKCLKILD